MKLSQHIPVLFFLLLIVSACSTPGTLTTFDDLEPADLTAEELIAMVPNYSETLLTISGSGRAIVSEPGNSERVTLQFQSNRKESLITVRNSVGIEGGQIFVDSDSLLIYNRIDRIAEKVPLRDSRLSSVGSIASINILDLINYTFEADDVEQIYNDRDTFVALLTNRTILNISKADGTILEVVHAIENYNAPYSRIEYDGYGTIEGFRLPRRITIYSRDGESRAALLVQRLDVNTELPELSIILPDDVPIYRP
ncbi:MAG: DUF4292 domain-containing protein [Balneolaceae bacterium]|nr:MAG: DUF4292 domain-containing protein [Balneolaceae bacterium]